MSTMTRAAEPLRADFEHREPRRRICRDETVRVLVNELLDWHGAPIILGRGKTHVVTYARFQSTAESQVASTRSSRAPRPRTRAIPATEPKPSSDRPLGRQAH